MSHSKGIQIDTLYTVPKKLDIVKKRKDRLIDSRQTHIVYKINCLIFIFIIISLIVINI